MSGSTLSGIEDFDKIRQLAMLAQTLDDRATRLIADEPADSPGFWLEIDMASVAYDDAARALVLLLCDPGMVALFDAIRKLLIAIDEVPE